MAVAPERRETQAAPQRRRWTRAEYYRAGELGLFRPGERLELIHGEIIEKVSPQGKPHAVSVSLAGYALGGTVDNVRAHTRTQLPITLPDDTEPEPDVAVARGGIRDYERRHPGSGDILLLVEVSDSTLAFDREQKARDYAAVGVPEYWIVNLRERKLEVHRDPAGGEYATRDSRGEAQTVAPLHAPDKPVRVADLLPSLKASEAPDE